MEIKDNFSPSDKFKMFNRIISCSGELREKVLSCKDENADIFKKIELFIYLFLKFEKQENREIDISKILDEEMVQDSFLSDKFIKILHME